MAAIFRKGIFMANKEIDLQVLDSIGDKVDPGLSQSLRTTAWVAYGLFALGLFTGGIFSILALILGYIQRKNSEGTIYESHFRNIIKTGLIFVIGGFVSALLMFVLIGFVTMFLLWCWCAYRVIKGGLALNEGRVYA